MTKLALSTTEVAPLLGVSARTVRRLVADGTLPHVLVASKVRIPVAALERWLLAGCDGSTGDVSASMGAVGGAIGAGRTGHAPTGAAPPSGGSPGSSEMTDPQPRMAGGRSPLDDTEDTR